MSTLIEPQPRNSSTDAPTDSDAAAKQVGRGPRILASLLRLLLPLRAALLGHARLAGERAPRLRVPTPGGWGAQEGRLEEEVDQEEVTC